MENELEEKVVYDYSKLRGKIKEYFDTIDNFAEKMHLSSTAVINKLCNRSPFKQPEITLACSLLDIAEEEIHIYFFTLKVDKISTDKII